MKTKTLTKLPYEAPDTSVDVIVMERCILSTTADTGQMQDMNWNSLDDGDDMDIDY